METECSHHQVRNAHVADEEVEPRLEAVVQRADHGAEGELSTSGWIRCAQYVSRLSGSQNWWARNELKAPVPGDACQREPRQRQRVEGRHSAIQAAARPGRLGVNEPGVAAGAVHNEEGCHYEEGPARRGGELIRRSRAP